MLYGMCRVDDGALLAYQGEETNPIRLMLWTNRVHADEVRKECLQLGDWYVHSFERHMWPLGDGMVFLDSEQIPPDFDAEQLELEEVVESYG